VAAIVALDAIGWRVTEIWPSLDYGGALWQVTIKRVDFDASITVTATDPDAALEEIARYAAADAPVKR
jgi:hypothetical protein